MKSDVILSYAQLINSFHPTDWGFSDLLSLYVVVVNNLSTTKVLTDKNSHCFKRRSRLESTDFGEFNAFSVFVSRLAI